MRLRRSASAARPRRGLLVLMAVLAVGCGGPGPQPSATRRAPYLGAHSEIYLTAPYRVKDALFAQAAALGASYIRLDIELSAVFPGPVGRPPDWTTVDQYMRLAVRYHLHILADLTATPNYLARCPTLLPPTQWYRCPPRNPASWAREAGAIAAHTRGTIDDFEIINEPDARWAFLGTAQQYAMVLSAAYRDIHAANPAAMVVLGGLMRMGPRGRGWMDKVLATHGADALHSFDVSNIHVRTAPSRIGGVVCGWRNYFASKGFRGPLWVTETGYPADPAHQQDPGYRDGPSAQGRWLADAIPAFLEAGAQKVFITLRDAGHGPYASEGVLQSARLLTPRFWFRRRPSFYGILRQVDQGTSVMMSRYRQSQASGAAC